MMHSTLVSRSRSRAIALAVVLVVLAGIFVGVADLREAGRLLDRTDWSRLPPALLLTVVSYVSTSAALVVLCGPMGIEAPRGPMLRIAVISVAVNNLVSFGGVAGYSLRAALSKPHGVAAGHSLAMSLTHAYLNNLFMFLLLAVGLFLLVNGPAMDPAWRRTLEAAGVLAVAFVLFSTAALFSGAVRRAILAGVVRLSSRLPVRGRISLATASDELDEALARAARALRRAPRAMLLPVTFLGLHWCAMVGAFWCCLSAFTGVVDVDVLVGGFSVGAVAGFASLLPGGIGVQDGSLAAVLALQGVSVEAAVLAVLLFRLVYYLTPFVATLPLYALALRQRGRDGFEGDT
ncbi:MAG: UPF0104 family protein [Dehalococcoidia bacterium]|nr:MAG: UPF0104 family protein [Dehalococcoidia bacterium]